MTWPTDTRSGDVPFRKLGLIPVAGAALLSAAIGVAVIAIEVVGDHDPNPLVVALGVVTVALGAWLARGVAERARADDPAIAVRDELLHVHVTPGRSLVLRRDQVISIDGPERSRHRLVVGRQQVIIITTTLTSRWLSPKIIVAERLIDAPIDEVVELLRDWHRSDT